LRVVQFLNYGVHVTDSLQTHSGGACSIEQPMIIGDLQGIC
jgi:hypothetical protein